MKHLADSERNGRMERVYAFTDEYGAFGWDIDNPSVSTHFIITAVIVKESNLSVFTQKANNLRKRHFQTGEIKSSRIGKDHNRRLRVLSDLQDIPFSFFSVCIDKKKCKENMSTRGLQYKKSFYKFMNNIVHREFRRAFEKITVVADEIGNSDYMQSFCEYVSFVDNHWCALWFGLYRFDSCTRSYIKREDTNGTLYIYLYLADTSGSSINGVYIGEDTYTVDLRRALPSYFLRPASQHGWVVYGKDVEKSKDYAENVLCVIEVKVADASDWLGSGDLLTAENFFPDYDIDDGYKVFLTRQRRSGVYKGNQNLILPVDTIKNYHLKKSFYLPPVCDCEPMPQKKCCVGTEEIKTITMLYQLLLEKGWTQETCFDAKWTPLNPSVGQSPATALLVQELFGGEIVRYTWKRRTHYFNRINGKNYDLTSQERHNHPFENYDKCTKIGLSKKSGDKIREKKDIIVKNIGIVVHEGENPSGTE